MKNHNMKNTLEYKILKYLNEKDNGEYIDMSKFIKDEKKLRLKLISLSKEKLTSYNGGTDFHFSNGNRLNKYCLLSKIEFKGIDYLNNLEKENKSIVNNGILIQDSLLEKSPIKQNINPAPKNNPEKKSLFNRIYSDPLVIGIILLLIAAIFNAERVKKWVDSIIYGL